MGEFHDHPLKVNIRENWCKPLLKQIHDMLGCKLIYLGLPGVNALDIISWIDFLDKVIAFECGDYSEKEDFKKKMDVDKLNDILVNFERKGKLKTFSLYNGYIEKVVLKGKDENGDVFKQHEVVTVYNLDFCNSLTVPMEIINDKGDISKHYKTDVICKLLEIQRDLETERAKKKFVMFVTVHSRFWEDTMSSSHVQDDPIFLSYIEKLNLLGKKEKSIRLLKAYFCKICQDHFGSRKIIPDFLPPIYYEGVGGHELICFTIIGTYYETTGASARSNQDLSSFLNSAFLTVDNKTIRNYSTKNFVESSNDVDPLKIFSSLDTIRNLWVKRK